MLVQALGKECVGLRKSRERISSRVSKKFSLDQVSSNPTNPCCRRVSSGGKLRRDSSSISLYFWEGFLSQSYKNTQNRSNKRAIFHINPKVRGTISPQNGPIFAIRFFYRNFFGYFLYLNKKSVRLCLPTRKSV